MSNFLGRKDLSRGIRNNNPGNLRMTKNNWQGKIPYDKNKDANKAFEQFETMQFGIRAMLRNLVTHIDRGENTIRKLITTYAPPVENNTELYIKQVASAVGLTPDATIKKVDSTMLFLLAKAIIKKENGQDAKYVSDSDITDSISKLGSFDVANITVDTSKKISLAFIMGLLLFLYTVLIVSV
ncbi:hypothetical protein [Flavobacterium sp. M31R6]|uniref:hypothetical protein n=1 Tax=Flavobacterium sp. M31R6 TaxID=2739062 RepID=UPI001569E6F0|nr:hypothetical protein [Flavobacterium sp. M31R6]QKJ63833.1 hypothetical protein HQN62_12065 [Flavobacterium sp. M31R6]